LKYFKNAEDAARLYDAVAVKLHKLQAPINFTDLDPATDILADKLVTKVNSPKKRAPLILR